MIDYSKKLTIHREYYPIADLDFSVESDRGRIISSAAFRRLQKRTQVFALELNAAVRSRLTHSLEVAQTSRFIAKTILKKLNDPDLKQIENAFISTAEMASMLHDIGNPPFGHFGEAAINEWMKKYIQNGFKNIQGNTKLKEQLTQDLCSFDGNAQAVRIVHKLQRMNLSFTQTAAILKYTKGAFQTDPSNTNLSYLQKKPGFFYSEKDFIKKICTQLEIAPGHRFPLTYIMEAADDISYLSADMEDAVDKGILSFDKIYELIIKECEAVNKKHNTNVTLLKSIVHENYEKAKENADETYRFNMFLTLTRAKLITKLVTYVSNLYIKHQHQIFEGSFNYPLLEYDKKHECSQAVEVLQNISYEYIYNDKQVHALEIKGFAVIQGLFNIYRPLLELDFSEFKNLTNGKKVACLICKNLLGRLSKKHLAAYKQTIQELDSSDIENFELFEKYHRCRLIIDYISGMTDDYALNEYQSLSAL